MNLFLLVDGNDNGSILKNIFSHTSTLNQNKTRVKKKALAGFVREAGVGSVPAFTDSALILRLLRKRQSDALLASLV